MRRWWALSAVVLLAAACGTGRTITLPGGAGRTSRPAGATGPRSAVASFLAGAYLGNSPTVTLQLRRLSTGGVIRSLPQTTDGGVLQTSETAALVAEREGCTAILERVGLLTGRVQLVRRFHDVVAGFSLSPNGTRLAYDTFAHCPSLPPPCPGTCDTAPGIGPDTVAVLDLHNGALAQTTLTGSIPHPSVGALYWSPDGRHIALTVDDGTPGRIDRIAIVDAKRPDLREARYLTTPAGCSEQPISWTSLGILTDEVCGNGRPRFTSYLVALTDNGRLTHRWAMPKCAYGISAEPVADTHTVVVEADIGYGTCSPEASWTARFWTLARGKLRPLFAVPGAGFDVVIP